MDSYNISEAKPKLGEIVSRAAAGRLTYLFNGKDIVALVPARPTHQAPVELDIEAVNTRLERSEKTPQGPWQRGDAIKIARQALRRKNNA